MDEAFELPVMYKGEEILLPTRLLHTGYVHRFEVSIQGHDFLFEPDEEQQYRALVNAEKLAELSWLDVGLLQAIAETLAELHS
jgi:hypothetical protein